MNKAYFIELFDYNYWAHRQVWNCIMQLTDEQFKHDLDYSIGSIWIQCVHTMAVEYWWFHYLREGKLEFLDEEDFPTRESIRAQWDELEKYICVYLNALIPEELERNVRPSFWDADMPRIKVWEAIMQVANHSTDHRAQTLAGLHRLDAPTVGQDVLDYLFETKPQPQSSIVSDRLR
jgi:uncharacterized damage-inducible protein DinB